MKPQSTKTHRKQKKVARLMTKSELGVALENGTFTGNVAFNSSSFDEASYINADVDDQDEIAELKKQRKLTFKQMESTYKKGLDEYVETRKKGEVTTRVNGTKSRKEPPREKEEQVKRLTLDLIKSVMQNKERIVNLNANLEDVEFESLVVKNQEYTDLTYCIVDILDKPLKHAFYIINELGWDIPVTRTMYSSILDGSLEFVHEKKKHVCHHFVYFGDIVKPSRNGKTLENYDPSVEYIPVKLQVWGDDLSSSVLKKELSFEFLLFSTYDNEKEEEFTWKLVIINPGFVLDQNQ